MTRFANIVTNLAVLGCGSSVEGMVFEGQQRGDDLKENRERIENKFLERIEHEASLQNLGMLYEGTIEQHYRRAGSSIPETLAQAFEARKVTLKMVQEEFERMVEPSAYDRMVSKHQNPKFYERQIAYWHQWWVPKFLDDLKKESSERKASKRFREKFEESIEWANKNPLGGKPRFTDECLRKRAEYLVSIKQAQSLEELDQVETAMNEHYRIPKSVNEMSHPLVSKMLQDALAERRRNLFFNGRAQLNLEKSSFVEPVRVKGPEDDLKLRLENLFLNGILESESLEKLWQVNGVIVRHYKEQEKVPEALDAAVEAREDALKQI